MRAISIKAAATWTGMPADSVVLDYDERQRRRITMRGKKGLSFLLDLPNAGQLHGGDALVLEDGRLIQVVAASEPLLEIRCSNSLQTARIAWHLGNRHIATQLRGTALRIRRDHIIANMAMQLGAEVVEIEAPFDPEGGAYAHHHRDYDHDG